MKSIAAGPIKKRYLYIIVTIVSAVLLLAASLAAWSADAIPFDSAILKPGTVTVVQWLQATDLSDDRKLVGQADDVFFGRVTERPGQTRLFSRPETQFRVKVLEVLKGTAAGEITVNQRGGWRWDLKQVRMDGDLQLLEVGKTYLFVTRTRQETGWHTLVPSYGDIEIHAPRRDAEAEVLGSQHASWLRQRFTTAVEQQIPYRRP